MQAWRSDESAHRRRQRHSPTDDVGSLALVGEQAVEVASRHDLIESLESRALKLVVGIALFATQSLELKSIHRA